MKKQEYQACLLETAFFQIYQSKMHQKGILIFSLPLAPYPLPLNIHYLCQLNNNQK